MDAGDAEDAEDARDAKYVKGVNGSSGAGGANAVGGAGGAKDVNGTTGAKDPGQEASQGIAQLEGYLLWKAETTQARQQAQAFTDRLPWLTTAQREDVERAYVDDRLALSKATLRRIADRAAQLRQEYGEHYRRLRARCVALSLFGAVALGSVSGWVMAAALK